MDNGASSYHRFLSGDDSGISDIIKEFRNGLILYLNNYVQNIHIAEDLSEEVFVRLIVNKPRFHKRSNFKTWLYTIGRNIAIDYLRKESKISEHSLDDLQDCISDEVHLENSFILEERKIQLYKTLAALKCEYRQVLYLKYFENFCNEQIASVMRKSVRQIENLVYHAKRALKSELLKEGFEYEEL